jgi:hypothetical protein
VLPDMTDDQPKRGRPSDYSFQVAISICARLAEGKSLRAIRPWSGRPRGWRRENTPTGAKGYQGPASCRDIVYQAQRVAAGRRIGRTRLLDAVYRELGLLDEFERVLPT